MQILKKRTNILDYTKHSKLALYQQGIYCIWVTDKPNTFYVGYAKIHKNRPRHKIGFNGRWLKHLSDLKINKHHSQYLQNVVNKYSITNIRFKILEIVQDKRLIGKREKYWIKKLNAFKEGYNSTDGGEILIISESTRIKMKTNSYLKGKFGQDNILSKIVYQYDLDGNYIRYFNGTREAERILGILSSGIGHACKGTFRHYKNFQWFYEYKGNRIKSIIKNGHHLQVIMLDIKTNKEIKRFDSITEAAEFVRGETTNISKSCKNNKYSCKGYKWQYLKENN